MDRRAQDELLEMLDMLRPQVGPGGLIVPLGSVRYHPSAMVVSGFLYPMGLVARVFADPETGHVDLSTPRVLVYDGVLAESAQMRYGLVPVLEQVMSSKTARTLAIFALDLDGVVLDTLVGSHQRKMCSVAAISCTGLETEEARHYLRTIARMCGATLLGTAVREGSPWAWHEALGNAGRLLADRYRTVIVEPARIEQAEFVAQPIGLLSVGGKDAQEVREATEWIEGLLGR